VRLIVILLTLVIVLSGCVSARHDDRRSGAVLLRTPDETGGLPELEVRRLRAGVVVPVRLNDCGVDAYTVTVLRMTERPRWAVDSLLNAGSPTRVGLGVAARLYDSETSHVRLDLGLAVLTSVETWEPETGPYAVMTIRF